MTEKPRQIHNRITVDADIMVGKPVVSGTRIPVEMVLRHLAESLDLSDLLAAYPRLTEDDVRACLEHSADLVDHEYARQYHRERSTATHP